MAFTYDDALTTDLAKVRFAIGDTTSAEALLTDGEITYLLTQYTTVARCAVEACKRAIAKLSKRADFTNGKNSVSASQRVAQFRELLTQLQAEALEAGGMEIVATGISISENAAQDENADAVQPSFRIGMDDLEGG